MQNWRNWKLETRQITDNWVLQTRTSWRGTGWRGSGRETELQQLNAGRFTMNGETTATILGAFVKVSSLARSCLHEISCSVQPAPASLSYSRLSNVSFALRWAAPKQKHRLEFWQLWDVHPIVYIRQRKIERIAQLDSEVAQLKLENQGLEQVGGPQRTRGALRMRRWSSSWRRRRGCSGGRSRTTSTPAAASWWTIPTPGANWTVDCCLLVKHSPKIYSFLV